MSLKDLAFNLLFPPKCSNCHELLDVSLTDRTRETLCPNCRVSFENERNRECADCGLSMRFCRCMPKNMSKAQCSALLKLISYRPQDLDSAVTLTAKLLLFFRERGIAVIRTGLHTIDETKYVAGPWHPAFRELCDAKIYLEKAKSALKTKGDYNIYVKKGSLSKMGGQKNSNLKALSKLGFNCKIKECEEVREYEIKIERVG